MANQTATMKTNLTYQSGGGSVTMPTLTIAAPYEASSPTRVDVPDATAADVEIDLPMGSIGTALTGLIVVNHTGQDLEVSINGSEDLWELPDGGFFAYGCAAAPATVPLTEVSVTTTGIQAGAGYVDVWAFGDPSGP